MRNNTIEDVLRDAVENDPVSYNALAVATGLSRPSIVRFVKREGTLRLDHAAKLCSHYGLELKKRED